MASSNTTTMNSGLGENAKWLGALKDKVHMPGMMGLVMGLPMYSQSRKEGHGVVGSALSATAQYAFWEALGPIAGTALMVGQMAPDLAITGYHAYRGYARQLARTTRPFAGGYQDTQAAYTMRQRAVQAIQESKINARSALGNEAQYMHR